MSGNDREKMTITAEDVGDAKELFKEGVGDLTLIQAKPEELDKALPGMTLIQTGQYGTFRFHSFDNAEVMRIERNGDVYVRGNKVDTDLAVYDGLRAWLCLLPKTKTG